MRRSPPVALGAALAWCLLCGWFAFVRDDRVPVVSLVDFGFHELGHLVMYVFPISELLTAAMGSIAQCAVPLGLAAYFWLSRADTVGFVACLAWAGTNLRDVSVYVADAPHERLELVGGRHDWAYILGPDQLDRLAAAGTIASVVRAAGLVVLIAAIAIACVHLMRPAPRERRRVPIRVVD